MKPKPCLLITTFCFLLIAAAGCGPSPDSARKQLADLRQDFTPADFVMAAVHGDTKAVELFIAAGMDVNVSPDMGMSALIGASGEGHLEIMKLLIQKGAKVNAKDNEAGVTALLLAAANGKEDAVKLLVQSGAKVNETDNDGDTALLQAVAKNHAQTAKFLLGNHADPNVENAKGLTALDCTDNAEIIQLLYQAGARKFTDHMFLEIANQKGTEMLLSTRREVQAFVENGGDPAQALTYSRKAFSPETVGEYTAMGMSSAQIASMLLMTCAAIKNAVDLPVTFSTRQIDPQRLDAMEKLLEDSLTAFTNACVAFINDPKADLNWRDWKGMTMLMNVAQRGNAGLAAALIAKGANPNLKDSQGKTAADYAQDNNQTNVVALLRAVGGTSGSNRN